MAKYVLTKDMYVKLRDREDAVDTASHCQSDVILEVSKAYRFIDGKMVQVKFGEVGRG